MMKFIVDDNIPYIKGRLEPHGEVIYTDQWGFTPELVKDADALVIRTRTLCNKSLLEGSKVSLIATATIGTDQIDMDWCSSNGIKVRNAPGCNAPGVAQYVWSSILRTGFDPERHTLGIVGCGNVGSVVKEWGDVLGAKMLICDPPRQERGDAGKWDTLEEVLTNSDYISLHTPLTKSGPHATFHLIGDEELAKMRPGAMLVNAARGPVVDSNSLRNALLEGRIKAVVDTWEGEPNTDPAILRLAAYATFHIAGYSDQGKQRATRMALEAVANHFNLDIDISGLEGKYQGTPGLSPKMIIDSYDPANDTAALRKNPTEFDTLRRNYHYRPETGKDA